MADDLNSIHVIYFIDFISDLKALFFKNQSFSVIYEAFLNKTKKKK